MYNFQMDREKINETLLSHVPPEAELITDKKFVKKLNLQLRMKSGFYYGLYENGDLSFLAHAEKNRDYGDERIDTYLSVNQNFTGGSFEEHMWGQTYYSNGTMEDLSAWDDSSAPYKTAIEPGTWLIDMIKRVK